MVIVDSTSYGVFSSSLRIYVSAGLGLFFFSHQYKPIHGMSIEKVFAVVICYPLLMGVASDLSYPASSV